MEMKMKTNHQNTSASAKENNFQFCGDRVDLYDWWSILNGISQDQSVPKISVSSKLYQKKVRELINTKEKLEKFWRRKGDRPHPILFTNYLLRSFMDAVGKNLKDSEVLRVLILDGIPLSNKYLEILCIGLSCNKNLRTLSLARCRIADSGCSLVLESLENKLNLRKLNFSSCNLTGNSGHSLSLFMKKRRQLLLKREWSECTGANKNSDLQQVRGLHTLILDKNPEFSDSGLRLLVDILKQDFWLKILHLRSCGLRDKGEAILDLLSTNCVITTMEFGQNNIPSEISEAVKKLLMRRKEEGTIKSLKKKILLTKNTKVDGEEKMKKKSIKVSSKNKVNLQKLRPPQKEKDSTLREKRKLFNSTTNFKEKPTPIRTNSQQKKKSIDVPSKNSSENQAVNSVELKLRISNIVDDNQKLSQHLTIDREVLAKEKKSRLKIVKCCDQIEPQLANICRGILAHIENGKFTTFDV